MQINGHYFLLRSKKVFIAFTWLTRVLLAIAFIPSGIKKVLGLRFTQMGIETQVGFFFEALYRTGFYLEFSGNSTTYICSFTRNSKNIFPWCNNIFTDCSKHIVNRIGNEFYWNYSHSNTYANREYIFIVLGLSKNKNSHPNNFRQNMNEELRRSYQLQLKFFECTAIQNGSLQ